MARRRGPALDRVSLRLRHARVEGPAIARHAHADARNCAPVPALDDDVECAAVAALHALEAECRPLVVGRAVEDDLAALQFPGAFRILVVGAVRQEILEPAVGVQPQAGADLAHAHQAIAARDRRRVRGLRACGLPCDQSEQQGCEPRSSRHPSFLHTGAAIQGAIRRPGTRKATARLTRTVPSASYDWAEENGLRVPMAAPTDARTVKSWLSGASEIALLDVREYGQYGEGHPFFAVSLPYSRFELGLPGLAPNPAVRLVLCDAGDGVAERAAARAESLGYSNVHIMAGGADAWRQAGYTLYAGVNVPSKTFGELIEHARNTPRVTAEKLQAMRDANEDMVIVDGRHLRRIPEDEHSGRDLLPERRARPAHPRHRPQPKHQDRRQLRRAHALHHRRADADRFRHPQSRLRARERHAGLDARGTGARTWRNAALCR